MKPYIAKVTTNGAQQKRFKEQWGIPVGNCVRSAVHKGMSIGAIHEAVRNCAKGRG
ncbi:MAG: hypothetical protein PHC43_00065 [Candidatus Marinimicrobia bacterium]|nr:hypothetical protein [Candidatus Neomarinimicrobiota bacterium]